MKVSISWNCLHFVLIRPLPVRGSGDEVERQCVGRSIAGPRPRNPLSLPHTHRQAASLPTAGEDRVGPTSIHQCGLPGSFPSPHRLLGHTHRRRFHDVGTKQFDLHFGSHTTCRRRSPATRTHVPVDARGQHRHDLHRHPRCSRLRPLGLPKDIPGGALTPVLQHLRHSYLVSNSGDAPRADKSVEDAWQHDGQVPLVRVPLSLHCVFDHPWLRVRSLGRRHGRVAGRRTSHLLLLRRHCYHQHSAKQKVENPSREAKELGLPATCPSFTAAVRQCIHQILRYIQMLQERQRQLRLRISCYVHTNLAYCTSMLYLLHKI